MSVETFDPQRVRRGCLTLIVCMLANLVPVALSTFVRRTMDHRLFIYDGLGALILALFIYAVWLVTAGARRGHRRLGRGLALTKGFAALPLLYLSYANLTVLTSGGALPATSRILQDSLRLFDRATSAALWVALALVLASVFEQRGWRKAKVWTKVLVGVVLTNGAYAIATMAYKAWLYLQVSTSAAPYTGFIAAKKLLATLSLYAGAPLALSSFVLKVVLIWICRSALRDVAEPSTLER